MNESNDRQGARFSGPEQDELLQEVASLRASNEQLRRSIAESHHRIKYSLQNVISLLNLQARGTNGLSAEGVKKLSAHIHGLAVLHDLMVARTREGEDIATVDLDRIFERVLGIVSRGAAARTEIALEHCPVNSRQAGSLLVVFNEMVSAALKLGGATVAVSLRCADGSAALTVKAQRSADAHPHAMPMIDAAGLELIKLLCQADLAAEPLMESTGDGWCAASVTFPLSPAKPR
jgi:two-component sensor histidine kinase